MDTVTQTKQESNRSWVKLYRSFAQWEWYADSNMVHLFLHLLLHANYQPGKWRGIPIERGQLVTGLTALSHATGISTRSLRTCLGRLISTGEITRKTTSKYSIITICNYDVYQRGNDASDRQSDTHTDSQATGKRQASDNQTTTNNKLKNYKKEKKERNIHTPSFDPSGKTKYLDWVYLSADQLASVKAYYQARGLSEADFSEAVRALDTWFNDNPKMRQKRTDDARALKGWPLDEALKRKRALMTTAKLSLAGGNR